MISIEYFDTSIVIIAIPSVSKNLKFSVRADFDYTTTIRTVSPDKPGHLESKMSSDDKALRQRGIYLD